MFRNSKAFSSFSTDDLSAAKRFYGETLGLEVVETPEGLELRIAGSSAGLRLSLGQLHRAEAHRPSFPVEHIDAAVEELMRRGVSMEHYDLPDIKTTDGRQDLRGNGEVGTARDRVVQRPRRACPLSPPDRLTAGL